MRATALLVIVISISAVVLLIGCEGTTDPGTSAQAGQGGTIGDSHPDASATPVANTTSSPKQGNAKSKPSGPRDISFDDLKFDIEPDAPFERSMLTPQIEALDGTRVRLRGYINPFGVFTQTGITQFIFVRDNMECCFGPGAALFDCTVVEMQPGKSTDYNIYPITVEGTFTISELVDPDGVVRAVFHIEGESAK